MLKQKILSRKKKAQNYMYLWIKIWSCMIKELRYKKKSVLIKITLESSQT